MGFNREDEDARRRRNPFGAVFGLLMGGASLAIAWALASPARDFIERRTGANLSGVEMLFAIGFAIFVVCLMTSALLYGVLMPKQKTVVKDLDLIKERKAIDRERAARKARRREVKKQMRNS